ncbi:hypothetical protein MXM41_09670 [Leclercia adecarboxylata]|uniref:hypothetical protein n=1 Tax=Leclercia adecarboxylata TaxID=83655 RepID=UPI002DB821F9|nr:hypothetical protein [Leclercia adecarboxylata]MEB6379199.1 hypothetical protein [Leclercia adecarboxylata]
MNRLKLTLLLSTFAFSAAYAECTGNYWHSTCKYDNGNIITISRNGDITELKGHNIKSGAQWEERTRVWGDDVITKGTAANGARWRETKHNKGNGEYVVSGVDANGNLYRKECDASGCNVLY